MVCAWVGGSPGLAEAGPLTEPVQAMNMNRESKQRVSFREVAIAALILSLLFTFVQSIGRETMRCN